MRDSADAYLGENDVYTEIRDHTKMVQELAPGVLKYDKTFRGFSHCTVGGR